MEAELEAVILAGADEEEIEHIILHNIFIDRGITHTAQFNLENLPDEVIRLNFRFERSDLHRLMAVLRIPSEIVTITRNKVDGLTALCILLRRLAYPNRLCDMVPMFHLSTQSLSQIINKLISVIMEEHAVLLNNLNSLQWFNREKLEYYAQAIHNKGAPMNNCWGFIDGTARKICRPSESRRAYSGHKRYHCIKFQSIICPDGIIVSLKGAYPGRRHDARIFRESGISEELVQKTCFDTRRFVLFGDQGYGLSDVLFTPFHGRMEDLPAHQQSFNSAMKVLRIAVEWGFQKVISEFAFVDFSKNQKMLLQDVDALYKVAVLLTNCHTCLYSSQTAMYFNTNPPSLETYIGH
ncbi:unnamed protein product [Acanthoscelides obtectus]|uniref:DDE Tnp4 domain-containing protein n=1 Tax=Acanthoscelides obtectus TaxID=200917 RepID=A0A9P0QIH3_ACAOB|nr:unnamed protein product [Acanthoscelides obtectus]CAK1684584.1 hypothetical protein AOBTE_LOCUS34948 [Acanthoscelides obtectus]